MEKNLNSFCEAYLKLSKKGTPNVVVTMTHIKGSAPQDIGARMIVSEAGIEFGTIGGGKIEAHCLKMAREFLLSKNSVRSQSHTWNLQKDIGMTCGGEVTLFFEVSRIQEDWNIVLFGAGHVSQELTRVLLRLDCRLTVIDNRIEWLDKLPKNSKLQVIHSENMSGLVESLDKNSFVALMTMGHATDVPILYESLKRMNFAYLGVIGSSVKRKNIEKDLRERGINESSLKQFICPIGEKLGSNTPAEIAISIVAQLLKARDGLI